jgi:CRP/FNR family transcriptional regulator, nitrogen oxide reductase regulator
VAVASYAGRVELLEGLSQSLSERILAESPLKCFVAGQEIFRAGEPKVAIYVLLDGLAEVSQVDRNGNEAILWLTSPGQVVGSLNFAADCTQSSNALAVQSSRAIMWSLPRFESILDRYPAVLRNAERIIARQMAELSCRICEVSTAPRWLCMGKALIRLAEQIGRRGNGSVEVDLTQETLAQLAGTTTFNVNRVLLDFERNGLVRRRRHTIVIRDLPNLRKLCV